MSASTPREPRGGIEFAARAAIAVLALAASFCIPDAAVDVATVVYADGSLERTVRIAGRTGEGKVPTGNDWPRDELQVALARPEAWSRVDVRDGWLEASGFFARAADVPPALAHHLDDGSVIADRGAVAWTDEDLGLLRRRTFVETWGDPFGASGAIEAVDTLIALAGRILRDDLRADLGPDVDLAPLDGLFTGPVRQAVLEVVQVERRFAATPDDHARRLVLRDLLSRHGVVVPDAVDDDGFWSAAAGPVLDAFANRLAAALRRPDGPVSPDEFSFRSALADGEDWIDRAAVRTFGSTEELERRATPALGAVQGGYGGVVRTRFRFVVRLSMPGRIVRTNGTPDGDAAVWFFRGESLLVQDRVLSAVSLEPDVERLRRLGARRSFTPTELLQLESLLGEGDPEGAVRGALEQALAAGSLASLRDREALPDGIEAACAELADLLEGAAPGPPD